MKTVLEFATAAKDFTQDDQLTDSLVKGWVESAYIEIFRSQKQWPHFQAKTTLTTAPATATYAFPAESGKRWRIVVDISDPTKRGHTLKRMSPDSARRMFSSIATGVPLAYSIWQNQLVLYPTPSEVSVYDVYGYRQPNDWALAANGSPDLPDEWEPAILDYVLAKAAQYRADWESAANHNADFFRKVQTLTSDALGVDPGENIIIGSYRGGGSGLPPVGKFVNEP